MNHLFCYKKATTVLRYYLSWLKVIVLVVFQIFDSKWPSYARELYFLSNDHLVMINFVLPYNLEWKRIGLCKICGDNGIGWEFLTLIAEQMVKTFWNFIGDITME